MELDFTAVQALSSPTRLRILAAVLEAEQTPTRLADELGKSKSTVASHLATLEEAGLVERDAEEGRRRVTYSATRQAEAIVQGKERKVKFSLASSALTGIGGAVLLTRAFPGSGETYTASAERLAMDAGGDAAAAAQGPVLASDVVVFGLGLTALLVAAGAALYALVLHQLPVSTT
ncbi:MAG: winged helix-turn-helix domain-containing protein [Candidatus Nanohaloarchaea archaeon]|nr:winged helix-turn-helix domain-containing protein [Candidatus Nanohaloarchaea archaeon]